MVRRNFRATSLLIVILLLPFQAGAVLGPDEGPAEVRAITIGPMVQNISASGVTVVWTTDTAVVGYLNYSLDLSFSNSSSDSSPQKIHELGIRGLQSNATYNYYVDGGTRGLNSTFKTAPLPGPEHFRFAVYGDTRTDNAAHAAVFNRMVSYDPEFILNVGDLVTTGASISDWTGFFGVIRPGVNDTCYWPSIGNHDYPLPYYMLNFSLPGNERWYSFDYGSAHIVALEVTPTPNYANGTAQNDWLRADLAAHNGTEWTFVFFHDPLYSSGGHASDTNARAVLNPIFEQYGVDVVFNGHDHDYEHADPGNGIQYFVTGGGGAPLSPVGSNSWTVYSESTYEFMILDVDDNITRIMTLRPDNSVVERFNISHPDRRAPAPVPVTAVDTGIGGQVFVNWSLYNESAQGDVAQYRLFYTTSNRTNVSGLIPNMTFPAGTFGSLVTGLENNTPYYFAVVAADAVPNINPAATFATATPTDRTLPAAPTGLRLVTVMDNSISLAWNNNSEPDLAGYRLFINDTGNGSSFHQLSPLLYRNDYTAANLSAYTTYTFTLDAIDGALPQPNNSTRSPTVSATTLKLNSPPSIIAMSETIIISEDSAPAFLSYGSVFSDPDGGSLFFTFTSSTGITVGETLNGTGMSIKPVKDWFGKAFILLAANDTEAVTEANITVTVTPVNDPPIIADFSPSSTVTISETQTLNFTLTAIDIDSPSASLGYKWFLDGNQTYSAMPKYSYETAYDSAGNHIVRAQVSDGEYTEALEWSVSVTNTNRQPFDARILSPAEGASFLVGTAVVLNGTARDLDNDRLNFTWYDGVLDIGNGANFSARLTVGAHVISLAVSDGEYGVRSSTVNITITPNTKPVVSITPAGSNFLVRTDRPNLFNVTATDAEGDRITVSWLEGGNLLGTGLSFSTAGLAPGLHTITVSVSDGRNPPENQTLNILIKKPPAPVSKTDNLLIPVLLVSVIAVVSAIAVAYIIIRRKKS